MAAQLRAGRPGVPLVRADGNALPFAAARFDLVTYAQAWHWTEPSRSVPEALRVLRPGGALALWWNVPDPRVPWLREQEERFLSINPQRRHFNIPERAPAMIRDLGLGLIPAHREVSWSRTIPLAAHLANLATHSFLAVLPPERSRALLDAEAERLAALFPGGEVEEAYVVRLTVVAPGPTA
jgi:SAM-dependent methyltransferase